MEERHELADVASLEEMSLAQRGRKRVVRSRLRSAAHHRVRAITRTETVEEILARHSGAHVAIAEDHVEPRGLQPRQGALRISVALHVGFAAQGAGCDNERATLGS